MEADRPILLSIGYTSCHWCHVMGSESFENPKVVKFINTHFVPIKVNHEQHPVLDQVFTTAMQLMNENAGGWPLTAFLTPEGRPLFMGTHFPSGLQPGRPSFTQVLQALAGIWKTDRQTLVTNIDMVTGHLAALATTPLTDDAPEACTTIETIATSFNLIRTGFETTPKSPSTTALSVPLICGNVHSLGLARRSLETMVRGDVYDQIDGSSHRYAVDPGWVVPHFEKTFNGSAMPLDIYIHGWRRTVNHNKGLRALLEHTACGITDFLERRLRDEGGVFVTGLDVDSCGIRGAVPGDVHCLQPPKLAVDVLGREDDDWTIRVFHVTAGGTFGEELSTLQLRGHPDLDKLAEVSKKLLAERRRRFPPVKDRLVVTSWNSPAIPLLVMGAPIWNGLHWLELVLDVARYMVGTHLVNGELRYSLLAGQIDDSSATAGDYDTLADALATLTGATEGAIWLRHAEVLCNRMVELSGADDGEFSDATAGELFVRPRSLVDDVTPSRTSALVRALRRVGLLAERPDLLGRADETAATTQATVAENSRSAGSTLEDLMIADKARRGLKPAMVVIAPDDPLDELARVAWRLAPAGSMILAALAGTEGFGSWLEGRGEWAVYVCRGQRCFDPVTGYTGLETPFRHRV